MSTEEIEGLVKEYSGGGLESLLDFASTVVDEVLKAIWAKDLEKESAGDLALMALFLKRLEKESTYVYRPLKDELWLRLGGKQGVWEFDNGTTVEFRNSLEKYRVDYDTLEKEYPAAYAECVKKYQNKGYLYLGRWE